MKTLPLAIFIHGFPGAGKTTLAQMIHKNMPSLLLLSNDVIRSNIGYPVIGSKYTIQVYKCVANMASSALSNGNGVLMDATFYSTHYRTIVLDAIREIQLQPLIIHVITPAHICRERIALRPKRSRQIDNIDTFDSLINRWENWTEAEMPKNSIYVEVDGSGVIPHLLAMPHNANVDVIRLLEKVFKERKDTDE